MKVICPYCSNEAKLISGLVIYPHRLDLKNKKFWMCFPCDAYVGCHDRHPLYSPNGDTPLGTMANGALRNFRNMAHDAFDPLWKNGPFRSRKRAYNWLANHLSISVKDCHIGMFDIHICRKVCIASIEAINNMDKL